MLGTPAACGRRRPPQQEPGNGRGLAKLLAALASERALRTYVAQHHGLWRCAQEQIVVLEETLATQPPTITKVAARLQTMRVWCPRPTSPGIATLTATFKRGSAALRTMLCEVAQHAQRPNHPSIPTSPLVRAARLQDGGRSGRPSPLPHPLRAALRDGEEFDVATLAVGELIPAHDGAPLPAQARGSVPRVSEDPSGATHRRTTRHPESPRAGPAPGSASPLAVGPA